MYDPPEEAPEDIVANAYDHIADWYLSWVSSDKSPRERYTSKLLSLLPASPHLLDLGCGPGVSILRMLLDAGAHVTANDISARQLEMARERCPEAEFVLGNMASLTFDEGRFHGVLSYYTLFHLPRSQLKDLLVKIHTWLKPGGYFVFNLAVMDEEEVYGEMMGHGMFWSSFSPERNEEMLREVGFELLEVEKVKAGDGKLEEGEPDYESEFLWVVARKGEVEDSQTLDPWGTDEVHGLPSDLFDPDALEEELKRVLGGAVDYFDGSKLDHVVFTVADPLAMLRLKDMNIKNVMLAGSVRFFAPLLLAKHLPSYLHSFHKASYIITTGTGSEKPVPNWSVIDSYAGGTHAMVRNLALDLKPIRVNGVSVGVVDTELWGDDHKRKEMIFKIMTDKMVLGRAGQPEDVAESYLALMKDWNIDGTMISTNGGSLLV